MHVRISEDAKNDLHSIENYIRPKNTAASDRVITAIFTSIYLLESFPLLGRSGRVEETREISVPRTPYIVVYRLPDEYHINIMRVLHERQDWPPE